MKKFTVKDFLSYNNPCFSCGEHVNFYFSNSKKDPSKASPSGYISPIVSNRAVTVDLKKTYSHSLTLNIYHQTNKFLANNFHELESYIYDNHISLVLNCSKCQTTITSKKLQFNLKEGFIKPVEVNSEVILVREGARNFHMHTLLLENNSGTYIRVDDNKSSGNPFELKIPPLPLYKFKNRKKLIEKINTYIVFS